MDEQTTVKVREETASGPKGRRQDAAPRPRRKKWPRIQVALLLPRAHVRVLEEESRRLGLRKSEFLVQLLLARLGRLRLVRPTDAPSYAFLPTDLAAKARLIWHCREQHKRELDRLCLAHGPMSPTTFIVLELNRFIGRVPAPAQGAEGTQGENP